MKTIKLTTVVILMLIFSAGLALAQTVPIMVSPNVINLDSEGTWVTVHAEIPYSTVVGLSVQLNGIEVEYTKADNRGELVAKFVLGDVKDYLVDTLEPALGEIKLTLVGMTTSGDTFSGTDIIDVINPTSSRK